VLAAVDAQQRSPRLTLIWRAALAESPNQLEVRRLLAHDAAPLHTADVTQPRAVGDPYVAAANACNADRRPACSAAERDRLAPALATRRDTDAHTGSEWNEMAPGSPVSQNGVR